MVGRCGKWLRECYGINLKEGQHCLKSTAKGQQVNTRANRTKHPKQTVGNTRAKSWWGIMDGGLEGFSTGRLDSTLGGLELFIMPYGEAGGEQGLDLGTDSINARSFSRRHRDLAPLGKLSVFLAILGTACCCSFALQRRPSSILMSV